MSLRPDRGDRDTPQRAADLRALPDAGDGRPADDAAVLTPRRAAYVWVRFGAGPLLEHPIRPTDQDADRITVSGIVCQHVGEDGAGRWIYSSTRG